MPQELNFFDTLMQTRVMRFGGINAVKEPHLLSESEAMDARDCDFSSGALLPMRENHKVGDLTNCRTFTRLRNRTGGAIDDEWPSSDIVITHESWDDHLVYTEDGSPDGLVHRPKIILNETGNPTHLLGITPPDVEAAAASGFAGGAKFGVVEFWDVWRGVPPSGSGITPSDDKLLGNYAIASKDTAPDDTPLSVDPNIHSEDPRVNNNIAFKIPITAGQIVIDVSTAGVCSGGVYELIFQYKKADGEWYNVAGPITQQYWSGSAWTAYGVGDFPFKIGGWNQFTWTPPSDNVGIYRFVYNTFNGGAITQYPKARRVWHAAQGETTRPPDDDPFYFNGTYQYAVVFVNETHGVISAPWSPNDDWSVISCTFPTDVSAVSIASIPQPPVFTGGKYYGASPSGAIYELPVEKIWLFRTTANGSEFYFLASGTPGSFSSYTDTTSDTDLLLNRPLESEDNHTPGWYPDGDGTYTRTFLRMIVFHKNRFYATGGPNNSVLFFSNTDDPHAWGLSQFIPFPVTILALHSTDAGLLVITEKGPWILSGTDATSMVKQQLEGSWNCASMRAIVSTEYGVIWPATDAIVMLDLSTGRIRDLSTPVLGTIEIKAASYMSAQYWKKQYLLFTDVGTLVADFTRLHSTNQGVVPEWKLFGWDWDGTAQFNPLSGESVRARFEINDSYYDAIDDKVYVLTEDPSSPGTGDLYMWQGCDGEDGRADSYVNMWYLSGETAGDDLHDLKIFDFLEVTVSDIPSGESLTVHVGIDGTTKANRVFSGPVTGTVTHLVYLPIAKADCTGYKAQILVYGIGKFYQATLHYQSLKKYQVQTLFHRALVTTHEACDIVLHCDFGNMTTYPRWRINATTPTEVDCHFDANTVGFIPRIRCYVQGAGTTVPSTAIKTLRWLIDRDEAMDELSVLHGARVGHRASASFQLYADGTAKGTTQTVSGDNETPLFFPAATKGKRAQAVWWASISTYHVPSPSIQVLEWWWSPEKDYLQRVVAHAVRFISRGACTVYLYLDGVLSATVTVHRAGENTAYFARNAHGQLYQIQWTGNGLDYDTVQFDVVPDQEYSTRVLLKGAEVAWDGDIGFKIHLDGTEDLSTTLSSSVHNSKMLEIQPPKIGHVYQAYHADKDATHPGWLHAVKFDVETEPPKVTQASELTGLPVKRAYIYSTTVTYFGAVDLKFYFDDVLRSDISKSLTTYDSTDWQTETIETIFHSYPTGFNLPIASRIAWDNEGTGFVYDVKFAFDPDMRLSEISPTRGNFARFAFQAYTVRWIGTGTLKIFVDHKLVKTKRLEAVTKPTAHRFLLPAGIRGHKVMYDYEEDSKNSLFVFNVRWHGARLQ